MNKTQQLTVVLFWSFVLISQIWFVSGHLILSIFWLGVAIALIGNIVRIESSNKKKHVK